MAISIANFGLLLVTNQLWNSKFNIAITYSLLPHCRKLFCNPHVTQAVRKITIPEWNKPLSSINMFYTLSKARNFKIVLRNWNFWNAFIKNLIEIIFNDFQLIKYKCLIDGTTGRTSIWEVDCMPIWTSFWIWNARNDFGFVETYCFSTSIRPIFPNYIGFGWNSSLIARSRFSEKIGSSASDIWLSFNWLSFIRLLIRVLTAFSYRILYRTLRSRYCSSGFKHDWSRGSETRIRWS